MGPTRLNEGERAVRDATRRGMATRMIISHSDGTWRNNFRTSIASKSQEMTQSLLPVLLPTTVDVM